MQANDVRFRTEFHDEVDQVACRRFIRRHIEEHDFRLQLPQTDVERMTRRIALQVRQDLKCFRFGDTRNQL